MRAERITRRCFSNCDGQVVGELELINGHIGQCFTPYDVSRLMAEITLQDAEDLIREKGFITLMEPASGAGGVIIAAADVIAKQGFDIATPPRCRCDRHFTDVFQDDLSSVRLAQHPGHGPAWQQPVA
jgi:type I restriction-modification system DNA methylase subunit